MRETEAARFREPEKGLWSIADGGTKLIRKVKKGEFWLDSMELSGFQMSIFVRYGVNEKGGLAFSWTGTWIALRTIPIESCGANFQAEVSLEQLPRFFVGTERQVELPEEFQFDGILHIISHTPAGLKIKRSVFAAADAMYAIQKITVTNESAAPLSIGTYPGAAFESQRGGRGEYVVENILRRSRGNRELGPGESAEYTLCFSARTPNMELPFPDGTAEMYARYARIAQLTAPLQLHTGIPELDSEFYFSKLRAGENIFRTRTGLLHSPGGRRYYASVWANDQLEYAAPWFGFTGDRAGIEASLNAFLLYVPFMGADYKAIPSSIVSEGVGFWHERGDRGDAAMYAYGASRLALASGNREIALKLQKPIEWCLEFTRRKLNSAGVPESDTDELETRLPSGPANLCTASLYYGALLTTAALERDMGAPAQAEQYERQAQVLEKAIESYFGANLHGFKTYRYYEGCEVLRSWMGIPLCMGITNRAHDTVDALFSPYLWLGGGMLSAEGDEKVWDRSVLYAFRGAFFAGITDPVFKLLKNYSAVRLTGSHIPYPFEAWPENDCRQTAAESALYTRIFTEGWFGITPAGLHKFTVAPHPAPEVPESTLENVPAFGHRLDFHLKGKELKIECDGEILCSGTNPMKIELPEPISKGYL